jgi:predicted AAA+ superfamily ATPase
MLPPFQKTTRRKPSATAKFYLFDVGIANHLLKRPAVERGSPEYGDALEHQVFLELRAYLSYRQRDEPLTFWRSLSKMEVDFVVGDRAGIEVKSAERVTDRSMKGLRALTEEVGLERRIIVSHERAGWRSEDGIEVMPVETFFKGLWAGEIV